MMMMMMPALFWICLMPMLLCRGEAEAEIVTTAATIATTGASTIFTTATSTTTVLNTETAIETTEEAAVKASDDNSGYSVDARCLNKTVDGQVYWVSVEAEPSAYVECKEFDLGQVKYCGHAFVFDVSSKCCVEVMAAKREEKEEEKVEEKEKEKEALKLTFPVPIIEVTTYSGTTLTTTATTSTTTDTFIIGPIDNKQASAVITVECANGTCQNETEEAPAVPATATTTVAPSSFSIMHLIRRHTHEQPRKFDLEHNCTSPAVTTCLNGGVCSQTMAGQCVCTVGFTDQYCQTPAVTTRASNCTSLKQQLTAGQFSVDKYALDACFTANGTARPCEQWSRSGKEALAGQASASSRVPAFVAPHVTYEAFWVQLCDRVWAQTNPELLYLRVASNSDQASVEQAEKWAFYAKLSSNKVARRFGAYKRSIGELITSVQGFDEQRAEKNAYEFVTEWNEKEKETEVAKAKSKFEVLEYGVQVGAAMRDMAEKACEMFEAIKQPDCNRTQVAELGHALSESVVKCWDMIVDYGFWAVTYHFADKYKQADQAKKLVGVKRAVRRARASIDNEIRRKLALVTRRVR